MTLLYIDGFDAQDYTLRWAAGALTTSNATFSNDTVTPYGGGSSLKATRGTSGSSVYQAKQFTASAQLYVGFAFATTSASQGHGFIELLGDNGATVHLAIGCGGTNGQLNLYRGDVTTLLASSALAVFPQGGPFAFVEISATIADVGGTCVVKVNGTTVINFTGDTKNAGTNSTIDTIRLMSPDPSASAGQANWFDDVYILNSLGSVNNTFLGGCRVQTLLPTGAGSSTQFTPVSGANYTNVNDVPDNTASYVSDTVSGHRDTYAMGDLDAGTDLIYGVQQVVHARQLDGGTATIKQAQKSGATVSYGTTKTLGAGNAAYLDLFETNPATSAAYVQSDVNALEAGFENV